MFGYCAANEVMLFFMFADWFLSTTKHDLSYLYCYDLYEKHVYEDDELTLMKGFRGVWILRSTLFFL